MGAVGTILDNPSTILDNTSNRAVGFPPCKIVSKQFCIQLYEGFWPSMTPENRAGGFRERLDDYVERLDDFKERLHDSWKDKTEIPSDHARRSLLI